MVREAIKESVELDFMVPTVNDINRLVCPACHEVMPPDESGDKLCVKCQIAALAGTAGQVPYKALNQLDKHGVHLLLSTLTGRLMAALQFPDKGLSSAEAEARVHDIIRTEFLRQVRNGNIEGAEAV